MLLNHAFKYCSRLTKTSHFQTANTSLTQAWRNEASFVVVTWLLSCWNEALKHLAAIQLLSRDQMLRHSWITVDIENRWIPVIWPILQPFMLLKIPAIYVFSAYSPFSFLSFLSVQSLPGSIDKAVAYLEKRLPHLTNPYAVAMTSYALANENKLNQEILYKFASPGVNILLLI